VSARGIVTGQKIFSAKAERARQLRREMTPAERLLWRELRRSSLKGLHFRRQQIIAGFIVDFYCHSGALVLEVDGSVHHSNDKSDAERDAILSSMGLRVLRVSNDEVMADVGVVLRKIVVLCET
jgi:very-short-patch-repair endonuclease